MRQKRRYPHLKLAALGREHDVSPTAIRNWLDAGWDPDTPRPASKPKAKPKPTSAAVAKLMTSALAKAELKLASEPEVSLAPEPEPEPEPKSKPEPKAEPKPKAESKSKAEQKPKPKPTSTHPWWSLKRWVRPRSEPHPVSDERPGTAHILIHLFSTLFVVVVIASLNVWPRVSQLLDRTTDKSGWGTVNVQLLLLILLGFVSLAWRLTRGGPTRCWNVAFAIVLFVGTFTYTVESVGYVHDAEVKQNRDHFNNFNNTTKQRDDAQAELDGLPAASRAEITDLTNERNQARVDKTQLPKFTPTSNAEITSQQNVVGDADKLMNGAQCDPNKWGYDGIGRCNKLKADLVTQRDKLERLQRDKATQDLALGYDKTVKDLNDKIAAIPLATQKRADELRATIDKDNAQLKVLGTPPTDMDPTAAYIANLFGGLLSADQISRWTPTVRSMVADIAAVGGPELLTLVIVAACL
jgi:hypothetical protein